MKNKKRIVVTGGAGFIGSHLVEKLIDLKYKVVVIDNLSNGKLENLRKVANKIKFVNADISKSGLWEKNLKNALCIFHLEKNHLMRMHYTIILMLF